MPYLEMTEVVLIHCHDANISNQQNSRVLDTLNYKLFSQLLDILPDNFIFLKTFDSEFSYTEVWLQIKI